MVNPPRRYIKISAAFRRSASLADYPTSTSHPTKFISCKSQSLGSPMFNTLLSKDPQLPCEEVYSLSRRKPCTTSFGQQWFHRGEKMITSLAISSMLPQEIHTTPCHLVVSLGLPVALPGRLFRVWLVAIHFRANICCLSRLPRRTFRRISLIT